MDTEKAKVFLTALKGGSFRVAAEELGYTTSGISRSIASLEEEVGVKLFIRNRKGVQPTREAMEFLPIFERLVEQERLFHETINRLHGFETGYITIGISYSAYYRIMAEKIKNFTESYPGIEVRTIQKTSSELLELMNNHQIDFAIMTKRSGEYQFHKLLEDPMVACISKENPLSKLEVFPLEKFGEEPMAVAYPDVDTDYRSALEERGIKPNIRYSASDVFAAYCMVEAGLGISLSNNLEVSCYDGNVALLKTEPSITLEIGIMYTKPDQMSLAAKRFLANIFCPKK